MSIENTNEKVNNNENKLLNWDFKNNLTLEEKLKRDSKKARNYILDMVYNAKSGHIGGSFSIIDVLTTIYMYKMNNDFENNKVVISKGHASPALYSMLYMTKQINEIGSFRKINGNLQGHPSNHTNGVSISTGSLGQGLSIGTGISYAKKLKNEDGEVFVIVGDGEMQEGQIWESLLTISKLELDNLTVIIDCNNIQLDGFVTDIKNIYPLDKKLSGYNVDLIKINGHNFNEIIAALDKKSTKTKIILANTIKGFGVSFMENTNSWHGKAPSIEEYNLAKEELKI